MRHLLPLKYIDAVARTRSIRAAAQTIAITPSALNRRILAVEEEMGVELFERTSKGVRLNSAGELFVQHIRQQLADFERVQSRIADLQGMRSGHVRIAATPEIARYFLGEEIQLYRSQFPGVSFEVTTMDGRSAKEALESQLVDVAAILEPGETSEFQSLIDTGLQVFCTMRAGHPLHERQSIGLMECLQHDLCLAPRQSGLRQLLEQSTRKKRLSLSPIIEANDPSLIYRMLQTSDALGFSIGAEHMDESSGLPVAKTLAAVPMDLKDVPLAHFFVGQLRFRTLPVATAKFVENLRKSVAERNQ